LHPQNDPWCNGSTPVFGIVSQGSSPCGSTKKLQEIEAFFDFTIHCFLHFFFLYFLLFPMRI
jgi:hypothetical protein